MTTGRVVVFYGLGGTIASTPGAGRGVAPALSAEEIVRAVPELDKVADIECVAFRTVPGPHLTIEDLIALARAIELSHQAGASGVVVMQGTDTIEETAFALDLLVGTPGVVVVTGAMRHPSQPGADGPANLLAAATVAASDAYRGAGVVVVLNDLVHAARWVRKTHTASPSAFQSPMTGPVGWIAEGQARLAWRPTPQFRLPLQTLGERTADVALLSTWLGDDGALVPAAVRAGYAGLVMSGLGGGHTSVGVAEALGAAAAGGLSVVLASRTGAGEGLRDTYGFSGSEVDLIGRGLLSAGPLDGVKARLLLALLLTRSGQGREDAAADFRAYVSNATV